MSRALLAGLQIPPPHQVGVSYLFSVLIAL
jgi:hypothetical protein